MTTFLKQNHNAKMMIALLFKFTVDGKNFRVAYKSKCKNWNCVSRLKNKDNTMYCAFQQRCKSQCTSVYDIKTQLSWLFTHPVIEYKVFGLTLVIIIRFKLYSTAMKRVLDLIFLWSCRIFVGVIHHEVHTTILGIVG